MDVGIILKETLSRLRRCKDQNENKKYVIRRYTIAVVTGDVRFAGTDANVKMEIWGIDGSSGPLDLRNSDHTNKFERAQTDIFVYQTKR